MAHQGDDARLMVDGCEALLRVLFGESNWQRWNSIKQHIQTTDTQAYVTWLLDVAEQELNQGLNLVDDVPKTEVFSDVSDVAAAKLGSELEDEVGILPTSSASASTSMPGVDTGLGHYFSPDRESSSSLPPDMGGGGGGAALPLTSGQPVEIVFFTDRNIFHCQWCQVSLSDIEIVKEHVKLRHATSPVLISCHCCNQQFPTVPDYVQFHRTNMAALGSKKHRFVCDQCAKPFPTRRNLEDHVASKHLKTGPRYTCPACQRKFSHCTSFASHKKRCAALAMAVAIN